MTRVLTGAALVALSLLVIKLAPVWLFWLLLTAVAVLASRELSRLFSAIGGPGWPWLAAGAVALTMTGFLPHGPPPALLLTAVLLATFVRAVLSGLPTDRSQALVVTTLAHVAYLGLTFGHVGGLAADAGGEMRGQNLLLFTIAAVYVGDIAAFYGGRAFGRHKLAPAISPKKSWEGAAFGVAGAVATAWVADVLFLRGFGLAYALALGAAIGVAGILGDLSESILKRAGRVKDSGALLPGHGGVLDRLDSLLFAAPVVYWADRLVVLASAAEATARAGAGP